MIKKLTNAHENRTEVYAVVIEFVHLLCECKNANKKIQPKKYISLIISITLVLTPIKGRVKIIKHVQMNWIAVRTPTVAVDE